MGYNCTIILTTCYQAPKEILEEPFWFTQIEGTSENAYILRGRKISVEKTLDQLCDLVWTRTNVAQRHHVLWADDFTSQDDSMGGRVSPLQWVHAYILVPSGYGKHRPVVVVEE